MFPELCLAEPSSTQCGLSPSPLHSGFCAEQQDSDKSVAEVAGMARQWLMPDCQLLPANLSGYLLTGPVTQTFDPVHLFLN